MIDIQAAFISAQLFELFYFACTLWYTVCMITWTNDTRKLSDLVPWEHNPKRMTKKQAEGLRLSIERFGFAVPFLIGPDNAIYDGHQRQTLMNAIKEYGPNAIVDVRVSSRPLTDDERRELVVRLKQAQAGWDFDILPNLYEREELIEWGFEPKELGMFANKSQGNDPSPQIDKAEELRVKWGVEPGQLWQLGKHRLICGDCTDKAVVKRLIGEEKIDGICTDPPYQMPAEQIINGLRHFGNVAVVLCSDALMVHLASIWQFHLALIWRHRKPRSFPTMHQPVFYHHQIAIFSDGTTTPKWKRPTPDFGSVIEVAHEFVDTEHGHGKGKEIFEQMMAGFDWKTVADPFVGSGATIIACEATGRRCFGVEIDPAMLAVALDRCEKYGLSVTRSDSDVGQRE